MSLAQVVFNVNNNNNTHSDVQFDHWFEVHFVFIVALCICCCAGCLLLLESPSTPIPPPYAWTPLKCNFKIPKFEFQQQQKAYITIGNTHVAQTTIKDLN